MTPCVVYQLPTGLRSKAITGAVFVVFGLAAWWIGWRLGLPPVDPVLYSANLVSSLLSVLYVHEFLHWILYLVVGAKPKMGAHWLSVHAPGTRLTQPRYLTVLLVPGLLLIGTAAVLLSVSTARPGAIIAIIAVPSLSAHDVLRAIAVSRSDSRLRWVDMAGAAEGC